MLGIKESALIIVVLSNAEAFTATLKSSHRHQSLSERRTNAGVFKSSSTIPSTRLFSEPEAIVSPFDGGTSDGEGDILELTWDNVEKVLDEMRPFLIQDGGNVSIAEIDGPVVRLQLEGACGTCPSSTQVRIVMAFLFSKSTGLCITNFWIIIL